MVLCSSSLGVSPSAFLRKLVCVRLSKCTLKRQVRKPQAQRRGNGGASNAIAIRSIPLVFKTSLEQAQVCGKRKISSVVRHLTFGAEASFKCSFLPTTFVYDDSRDFRWGFIEA